MAVCTLKLPEMPYAEPPFESSGRRDKNACIYGLWTFIFKKRA